MRSLAPWRAPLVLAFGTVFILALGTPLCLNWLALGTAIGAAIWFVVIAVREDNAATPLVAAYLALPIASVFLAVVLAMLSSRDLVIHVELELADDVYWECYTPLLITAIVLAVMAVVLFVGIIDRELRR